MKARRTELDDSASSIEDLIEVLDTRKDEAIERTFKQVSKYFEEVFEKLVPAGRGRLIMQKREEEQVRFGLLSSVYSSLLANMWLSDDDAAGGSNG